MATFLYSARAQDGSSVTEELDAESLETARYKLELRGFTAIKFHTDESMLRVDAHLREEMGGPLPETVLSPKQQVEARQGGGALSELWSAWKVNQIFWLPIGVWVGVTLFNGRPYGWGDWTGFALGIVFIVYFFWLVVPGVGYQLLLDASVWNREAETRRLRRLLLWSQKLGCPAIPKLELDLRLAWVLARSGKIEEGRELARRHEESAKGNPTILGRLAGFYVAAGEHERAHILQVAAAEASGGGLSEQIDLALGLVREQRKADEASEVIEKIADKEMSDMAKSFVAYVRGLIALENSKWKDALHQFEIVRKGLAAYQNPSAQGLLREVDAYCALAFAGNGDLEEGRQLLERSRPLLEARKEARLLDRLALAFPSGRV